MKKEIADFISTQFYNGRIKTPLEVGGILKNTDDKILSSEYPVVLFKRYFQFEYDERSSVYNLIEIKFKIKFNQIRCPDCEQLHKMQTFLEEKPREWKCIDGDIVRSNDETLIDNWLNHNNIKHQVEMKIPIQQLRYCDWYIPDYDIYIEFWGDVHTKYPEARKVKEKLYQKNKLKLKGMVVENVGKTTTLAE